MSFSFWQQRPRRVPECKDGSTFLFLERRACSRAGSCAISDFRWLTIMRVATLLEMFGSRGVARRFLFPTQSVRAVRRRTTTNMLTAACLP